jgi:hypothetical protein
LHTTPFESGSENFYNFVRHGLVVLKAVILEVLFNLAGGRQYSGLESRGLIRHCPVAFDRLRLMMPQPPVLRNHRGRHDKLLTTVGSFFSSTQVGTGTRLLITGPSGPSFAAIVRIAIVQNEAESWS